MSPLFPIPLLSVAATIQLIINIVYFLKSKQMVQPRPLETFFNIRDNHERMFDLLMSLDDCLGAIEKLNEHVRDLKDEATLIWESM